MSDYHDDEYDEDENPLLRYVEALDSGADFDSLTMTSPDGMEFGYLVQAAVTVKSPLDIPKALRAELKSMMGEGVEVLDVASPVVRRTLGGLRVTCDFVVRGLV